MESFKIPGGSVSSPGSAEAQGTCVHACTCSLEHVYTGVFWVTGLSLEPFLPHWEPGIPGWAWHPGWAWQGLNSSRGRLG